MNTIQAFRILQLHPNASQKDVKQAFKRLAKQYHPDVCNYDSTAKFQRINNAYQLAYEFAGKNKNVHKPKPPAKTTVKQPDKTKSSKNATSTCKTKHPSKNSNKSSSRVGWIIVGVVAFILLCLMVPGLQLVVLILILYCVTRIL